MAKINLKEIFDLTLMTVKQYINNNFSKINHTHSDYAPNSHTHNYAGSSSAGGAATSANKVNSALKVQLNSGTTEGTDQFTFNGSIAKTVNITPSNIGAAASSHGTHLELGTTSTTAFRGDRGNTAYNHSQSAHAPINAQRNGDITKAEIEAKLTGSITSHSHTTVNGYSIWTGTQSQYNALSSKSSTTLYFITG